MALNFVCVQGETQTQLTVGLRCWQNYPSSCQTNKLIEALKKFRKDQRFGQLKE